VSLQSNSAEFRPGKDKIYGSITSRYRRCYAWILFNAFNRFKR